MAEKKTLPTYDGIMRDLKNNVFAPIYILMGDEAYYIDQVCDYIQSHALPADQQAFDQTVVFGADVSGSQIADLAMQFPMMAPKRVIIVKEAQGLRSLEKLERYAQNPQPKTILVICYKNGVMNKRLKLVSAVEKSGVVFESKKLRVRSCVNGNCPDTYALTFRRRNLALTTRVRR